MTLEISVLVLGLAAIASVVVVTLMTGAPPLPTSAAVRETMLAVLPEDIEGPIYELGSGWGGLALALARRHPGRPVRAFETSPLPWAFSRARLWVDRQPNLSFRFGDFHRADLSDAALVAVYLTPPAMEKLKPKLEAELLDGALVVSNTFGVRGWRPVEERTVPDAHASRVYLYRV